MQRDYLNGLESGSHCLTPLLRFLEHKGISYATALRKTDPEELAACLATPFASADPVRFVQLIVTEYPTLPLVPDERFAQLEFENSCAMLRKYVAYALGQLGYESSIEVLERIRASDPAAAIREAARASLVAIRQAPANRGHTEEERLALIEAAYMTESNEPDSLKRHIELNMALMAQSNDDERAGFALKILEIAEKIFATEPKTEEPEVFLALGLALWNLEKARECIGPLETALQLFERSGRLTSSTNFVIRRPLGIALASVGAVRKDGGLERRALVHLKKAELDPGDPAFKLMVKLAMKYA